MNAYDLPTSLIIGGVERPIRTGWRVVMDIFAMFNDPDFDNEMKAVALVKMIYPTWQEFEPKDISEAITKAYDFLDCGQKPDDRHHPKLVDWEEDAALIVPAVNSIAGVDVRTAPNIHWWTFFSWYMGIRESLFSTVLHIRKKKQSGKQLEKWEQEFVRENRNIIEMRKRYTAEETATQEYFQKWLGG